MAGHGGGAWKVAYADFVTAMMAFFMVMWLTTQKQGVKEAVAGYFRDPFATFKSTEKGAAATAVPVADPMYGHTATPQKRKLKISGDSTDYQFTVLFSNEDAAIDAGQLDNIKSFAPMMVGKLNRVEIRGHSMRRPLPQDSPYSDHWQLCYARCQSVRKELEALGIEPERIRLSQAEGNEPLSRNLSEEELKLNSRVDVILLPDLAEIAWDKPAENAPGPNVLGEAAVNVGMSHVAPAPEDESNHGSGEEKAGGHGEKVSGAEPQPDGSTNDASHGEHEKDGAAASHGVENAPSHDDEKTATNEHAEMPQGEQVQAPAVEDESGVAEH
jgi:chemotaxis protein MotB